MGAVCTRCGGRPYGAVASYRHEDGTWSHVVPDSVTSGMAPEMATVIVPARPKLYHVPANGDKELEAVMLRAVDRWTGRTKMIGRYLRMWHRVAAVGEFNDFGCVYIGALSVEAVKFHGINDPDEHIRFDLGSYVLWLTGETFGVIRTGTDGVEIESTWGYQGYPGPRDIAETFHDARIVEAWEQT